jgi:hypothetical protein
MMMPSYAMSSEVKKYIEDEVKKAIQRSHYRRTIKKPESRVKDITPDLLLESKLQIRALHRKISHHL